MFRAWHDRARPVTTITSVLAALLLMTISLGVGGSASADPGNGAGGGKAAATAAPAAAEPAAPAPTKAHASSGGAASSHKTTGTAGTSGDVSKPQPKSTADQNGGGANGDCGAYCSTRDGSPSKNGDPKGTGGGKATGKPCAGCVGKADNKNPPGQYKDGSDHNAGYECDRNQGIGKTNPAHTGCTTSSDTAECQPKPGQNADCTNPPGTPGCQPKPGQNADCTNPPGTPECQPKPGQDADCTTPPGTPQCQPKPGQNADCTTPGAPACVVTPTNACSTPECVESDTVTCNEGDLCTPTDEVPCDDEQLCVPSTETTCAFDNLGEEGSRGPVANEGNEGNEGTQANRAPVVLGVEASRPVSAQPTQGALPNTGASSLLDLLAATGLGLLLVGGATVALRRRSEG